jgi:hypothetical protein
MARIYFFYPSGPRGAAGENHLSGRASILENNLVTACWHHPKKNLAIHTLASRIISKKKRKNKGIPNLHLWKTVITFWPTRVFGLPLGSVKTEKGKEVSEPWKIGTCKGRNRGQAVGSSPMSHPKRPVFASNSRSGCWAAFTALSRFAGSPSELPRLVGIGAN